MKSGKIKSCSFDPLPVSIVAKCYHALVPMLARIINSSLATGETPEDLKCAMLRPPLSKKPTADHMVQENMTYYFCLSTTSLVACLISNRV